jgi:hypothetical protein
VLRLLVVAVAKRELVLVDLVFCQACLTSSPANTPSWFWSSFSKAGAACFAAWASVRWTQASCRACW